jgi:hypothetical protein
MKTHILPVSAVGFLVLSGCGGAAATVDLAPSSDTEAVSVRKEDCVFGQSFAAFLTRASEDGFGVKSVSVPYESLTATQREQLASVSQLADEAALQASFLGKDVSVTTISEFGGPRVFELIQATPHQGLEVAKFVLAGTSAVVAELTGGDAIKSCMVTKLGGLDLRGRECAFGDSVGTWTAAGSVNLGDRRAITASTPLSAMRKAQLLGAARSTDLAAVLGASFDEIYYRTVTVPGLDEKFTYLWHYPGDTEVGAIFRQGSADIVARVGDQDIEECLVAAPKTSSSTPN